MELASGSPQNHQQHRQQQQQLHAQENVRVPQHQHAEVRQQAQAQNSAPTWQQQQQFDYEPSPLPTFNSELLSQDLEQVLCLVTLDAHKNISPPPFMAELLLHCRSCLVECPHSYSYFSSNSLSDAVRSSSASVALRQGSRWTVALDVDTEFQCVPGRFPTDSHAANGQCTGNA